MALIKCFWEKKGGGGGCNDPGWYSGSSELILISLLRSIGKTQINCGIHCGVNFWCLKFIAPQLQNQNDAFLGRFYLSVRVRNMDP